MGSAVQDNARVVQGMYAAFAEGDVNAVLEAMDPKIEWNEAESFPYADRNPYIGPEAVLEGVFMRLAVEWENWSLDIEDYLDAGDAVVARGRYSAKYTGTGAQLDVPFAHVWWLRDAKVVRFQQYTDTKRVAEVMKRD